MILLSLFVISTVSFTEDRDSWGDTSETSRLWELIQAKKHKALLEYFVDNPKAVWARSSDGRGPLFWAWEYYNPDALAIMAAFGVDPETKMKDRNNRLPTSGVKKKQITKIRKAFQNKKNKWYEQKKELSTGYEIWQIVLPSVL